MATSEGNFRRSARAYLAAIDKYNGKTNAILTKLEELAMEQAARADEAEQRGEWLGLLHGVCITLKDCLHVAGYRTTYGSALYAEQMSKSDSAVVARLRQAGAIFLGKSNLTEFCYGATGENPAYGDINNPWSLDRVPGGSSSGAAAAAATDVCRLAIGSSQKVKVQLRRTQGAIQPAPRASWTHVNRGSIFESSSHVKPAALSNAIRVRG